MRPVLLDTAINSRPRMRAWMFSSVTSKPVSPQAANGPASSSSTAVTGCSMGSVSVSMPRFAASASASATECALEKRDGISTPSTCSAPSASQASAATRAESMPPERPMSTSLAPLRST